MTIPDAPAIEAMRRLALRKDGPPIVCGESGAAGLAGLLAACANTGARLALGLDPDSHVLVFGTEGATDPGRYRELTGLDPAQLLM
ncbi:MAG: hypothetical protein MO853_13400 [Candidatus Protistobacter heckmanni]|nr:hypothetical protein [Candidatus Protistobacter heckmanni]